MGRKRSAWTAKNRSDSPVIQLLVAGSALGYLAYLLSADLHLWGLSQVSPMRTNDISATSS